jgi:hypothetical protein
VPTDDDAQAELLRQFQAAISGAELADLRQLAGDLGVVTGRIGRARPELRRPPLEEVQVLRVRADLDSSEPPIWRRLHLRSDLTLDVVHQVLQAAFGWTDSHLHRFSLGGHPFDLTSQLFLCPFDVEEGEDDGVPAADVRLDEALHEPGDVVAYVYDYGDSWEITLRLEGIAPAPADAPSAALVDGQRAAPPEDCGGAVDTESLALVVDDPDHFDADAVNEALRNPYFVLREHGAHPRLVEMLNPLRHSALGDDPVDRALSALSGSRRPERQELGEALRAFSWFLDRARDGGIQLTSAGYLKPRDVEAASAVVPTMSDWPGKNNREVNAVPVLDFRQTLQDLRLLRKYKGRLLPTRLAATASREPERLWELLADLLVPVEEGFEQDATLLVLLYAASSPAGELPRQPVGQALTELGWRHRDGRPLEGYEILRLPVMDVLANVGAGGPARRGRSWITPAAAALARQALNTSL